MNKKELREYQLAQLELLDITDEICKTNNLTYYLIGGTLLGAVRHNGFIPWDADMDIAMPREDYERFLKYWMENPSERYFYQHFSTEKNHLSPHAILKIKNTKVVMNGMVSKYRPKHEGIYMDVFPLDNPPKLSKQQKKQAQKIKKIKRVIELKSGYEYSSTSTLKKNVKKLIQIVLLPISFTYLNRKMDNCMKKYSSPDGECLVSMASHYSYWKQLMPKKVYGVPTKVCFEGKFYSAPAKVDEYLTRIYKDYMKEPSDDNLYSILDFISKVDYNIQGEK